MESDNLYFLNLSKPILFLKKTPTYSIAFHLIPPIRTHCLKNLLEAVGNQWRVFFRITYFMLWLMTGSRTSISKRWTISCYHLQFCFDVFNSNNILSFIYIKKGSLFINLHLFHGSICSYAWSICGWLSWFRRLEPTTKYGSIF
jgi:hypothetical protein